MTWTTTNYGLDVHVLPVEDLKEHDASWRCWCNPSQDAEEPRLWTHRSMDRREEYEQGRKPS